MQFTINELGEIRGISQIMQARGQAFENKDTGYWFGRFINQANSLLKESQKDSQLICEKTCLRDINGKPITKPGRDQSGNQINVYQFPDGIAPEELSAIGDSTVEVEVKYFPVDLELFELKNGGWDPNYLRAFNKLIIEPNEGTNTDQGYDVPKKGCK